jgi:hypothetical protein
MNISVRHKKFQMYLLSQLFPLVGELMVLPRTGHEGSEG